MVALWYRVSSEIVFHLNEANLNSTSYAPEFCVINITNLNLLRGHVPLIYLTLAYCVSLNVVLYDHNLSLYLIHGCNLNSTSYAPEFCVINIYVKIVK
jgi:hypothetical protein